MKETRLVFAVVFTLAFFLWGAVRIVARINFDRYCEGYLKRAADANTVDLAIKNLEITLKYADENNLKSGFTSILYRTPDEDIGFWYENLSASLNELRLIKPEASQLEKTNVLIKLRETLLDQGQSTSVTVPSSISIYPNNTGFFIWGFLVFVLLLLLGFFG